MFQLSIVFGGRQHIVSDWGGNGSHHFTTTLEAQQTHTATNMRASANIPMPTREAAYHPQLRGKERGVRGTTGYEDATNCENTKRCKTIRHKEIVTRPRKRESMKSAKIILILVWSITHESVLCIPPIKSAATSRRNPAQYPGEENVKSGNALQECDGAKAEEVVRDVRNKNQNLD